MAPKNSKMKGSSSNVAVSLHQTKRKPQKRQVVDPEEKKKEKNKRDRERRAAVKLKYEKMETQSKQTQDENTELKRENNELKSMLQNSENQVIERNPPLHGMEARTNQLSSGWQLTKIEASEDFRMWSPKWTPPCAEFRQMEENVKSLGNATESLANDNELLKSRVPLLENAIAELRSNLHQKTEELKRLQTVESQARQQSTQFWKLQEDVTMLRNSNDSLVKENEFLNSRVPLLENEIEQLKSILRQKGSHFNSFEEVRSWLLASPTHSEEDAANNVHITEGPRSSQGGRMYTDELVHNFTKKLDAKDKSQVDFSDFGGLMEEVVKSGMVTLPPSLALIDKKIKEKYGEIAAESKQSRCTAMPSRILLCAAIKEMDELQLDSIDEKKMLLWRDAINSALNINFKVGFAIEHLKKIGRAYFGLKARDDQELRSIEGKISTLQIELSDWEEKRAKKVEEQNSEVRKECLRDAEHFQGKSLSVGLLH